MQTEYFTRPLLLPLQISLLEYGSICNVKLQVCLLLDPEDESDKLFRHVRKLLPEYPARVLFILTEMRVSNIMVFRQI
jgi:hypothetical protein